VDAEFVFPEQIDRLLNWPLGTTARLVRRRQLPHYILPDYSVRLRWAEVEALVRHIRPRTDDLGLSTDQVPTSGEPGGGRP